MLLHCFALLSVTRSVIKQTPQTGVIHKIICNSAEKVVAHTNLFGLNNRLSSPAEYICLCKTA